MVNLIAIESNTVQHFLCKLHSKQQKVFLLNRFLFRNFVHCMVKKVIKFAKWIVGLLFVSTILSVIVYRFIPVYFTPLMLVRCFEQIGNGEKIKLYHHWIPIEKMSPSMPVAVIASEDQRFLTHHGFDYQAIEQAAKDNLNGKKRILMAGKVVAAQGFRGLFHLSYRNVLEQTTHNGGISQLHRNGRWHIRSTGLCREKLRCRCHKPYPFRLCTYCSNTPQPPSLLIESTRTVYEKAVKAD